MAVRASEMTRQNNILVQAITTHKLLGVSVNTLDLESLSRVVDEAVSSGDRLIVGNHNLNSVILANRDAAMREFYAHARYNFIDGMSLILIGRLLGLPLKRSDRMTSVDWLRPFLAEAVVRGWRIFFLGSRPGVGEAAVKILRDEFPALQVRANHGYFDLQPGSEGNREVLSRIRDYRPHILMVGMGMPLQEYWIVRERERIEANVVMNLGAFMDYIAGTVPVPPRWMAGLGFEWLSRLVAEPRRLWRRYLLEPWLVLPLLLRDLIKRQKWN